MHTCRWHASRIVLLCMGEACLPSELQQPSYSHCSPDTDAPDLSMRSLSVASVGWDKAQADRVGIKVLLFFSHLLLLLYMLPCMCVCTCVHMYMNIQKKRHFFSLRCYLPRQPTFSGPPRQFLTRVHTCLHTCKYADMLKVIDVWLQAK